MLRVQSDGCRRAASKSQGKRIHKLRVLFTISVPGIGLIG
jgi:hypothetical protein